MSILDTILQTPVDISAVRKENAPLERILDGTFTNFLFYAKTHWSYKASSKDGGEKLLAGTAMAVPCGGIATALKLVFTNGLGVSEDDIEYKRVLDYVWTGPQYLCFDSKVRGNLRLLDSPNVYGNGCIFNEHYYLQCNGKYYDPCLSTTYAVENQSIKVRIDKSYLVDAFRKMLVTPDHKTCILYMPQENVPGFTGAWAMFDTSKKNIEKALGSAEFKKAMAAMQGTSEFAKFVNSLTK